MPYSLQSAATACGVNRSTILRAIKSGRISATKDELGAWVLEPVEVHPILSACCSGWGKCCCGAQPRTS